jgi:ubiquinone/menaquinone biosynthesis C-methylase UbiE
MTITETSAGNPEQKRTYERADIHEQWEAIYRNNPDLDRLNEKILDRIQGVLQVPPNAVFLDAGCGTGDHSIRIAKRGFHCIGVDISEWVLAQAAKKIEKAGVQEKVALQCHALGRLPFSDGGFDVVHCRGVLMHIPRWEVAVQDLCRVLKPGGGIAILENNQSSLELLLVRIGRRVTSRKSTMVNTRGGLEFWSDEGGNPFVVRYANIRYLENHLRTCGIQIVARFGTGILDMGRLPPHFRYIGAKLNRGSVRLRVPARLSGGNAIVGIKK